MKKVLVLCEGQTEETFVNRILSPHLVARQVCLIPTLLKTKRVKSGTTFKGGVTSYEKLRQDVRRLLRDSSAVLVTTLLDYYGLPPDFPGKSTLRGGTPHRRVEHLERAFAQDIGDARFLPYLMLHEFEALLFVRPREIFETLNQPVSSALLEVASSHNSPEEINEGQTTHPAARIQQYARVYRKALHGPLIVERIGLPSLRSKCPHFDQWLIRLEAL